VKRSGVTLARPVPDTVTLSTSPANFTRNEEQAFSYVFKQPETPEEELLSKDAMDNCPVEAIGNDGP
jgi:ferredoxin